MTETVRALLEGAVDYAGLFPPAQLSMRDAVERYASYRSSPHAWMLGRFVVPATRLGEFSDVVRSFTNAASEPWRLSVLIDDVARDVETIHAFNRDNALSRCDVVEDRAASEEGVRLIGDVVRNASLRAYIEVRVDSDPGQLIKAIAKQGLGAKVRTGGVVASAIPSASQIARFLSRCVRSRVPFKATAGLHHPLRGEYRLTYEANSPTAVMFGYLNVFLAAALLRNGSREHEAIQLLEERDATSIRFDAEGVTWRGRFIPASVVATFRREMLAGFGSCSFTEPVDEIVALGFA